MSDAVARRSLKAQATDQACDNLTAEEDIAVERFVEDAFTGDILRRFAKEAITRGPDCVVFAKKLIDHLESTLDEVEDQMRYEDEEEGLED